MATQDEKDWEEYQLGQQGILTGSMHNQMGLNDRPPSFAVHQQSQPKRSKQQSQSKTASKGSEDFSVVFAVIAFVGTAVYIYNPADENGGVSLIGAAIAAFLAGKLYKFIIGLAIFVGVLFCLGAANGGGS